MSKIMIVEQIIEINNKVTPSTYDAVDRMNNYTGGISSGYQDLSINGENPDIADAINGLTDLGSIQDFLAKVSNSPPSPDNEKYSMTHWSSLQFAQLQQKITDCLKGGDDKSSIGTVMSEVQGIQGTFNSYTTEQLTSPQALEKEIQGVVSQLPGRFQVDLDAAGSVMTLIGLYANLPKS